MKRFDEALRSLVVSLSRDPYERQIISEKIQKWALENFEKFHVQASIHEQMLLHAKDADNFKAHLVRRAVIDSAIGFAAECAIGTETEPTLPWLARYSPHWAIDNELQHRKLALEFVGLRRTPLSERGSDVPQAWLAKIKPE
jgi:hypothetical protein